MIVMMAEHILGQAWLSFSVDTELLRRPFGVYLLAAGIYTLLQKPTKP